MILIRASYLRKRFVSHLLMGALLIAALFLWEKTGKTVDARIGSAALGAFILLVLLTEYTTFIRPMNELLRQIGFLLTGRKYTPLPVQRIDEVGVITHFFNEVTKTFGTVTGQLKERQRMVGELSFASQIQRSILPEQIPVVPGLTLAVRSQPAVEVGGDCYDVLLRDKNAFFYLGDATGHGVPAALIMTMVSTLFSTLTQSLEDPKEIMAQLNTALRSRMKAHMFMTVAFFRWQVAEKQLSLVGGGHERLLIHRAGKGTVETVTTGGIALGMIPDNRQVIREVPLTLESGDTLLLYSDGIKDAKNAAGETYGLNRLLEAFTRFAVEYSPDGIVHHLAQDLAIFAKNQLQEDDMTLMAIRKEK